MTIQKKSANRYQVSSSTKEREGTTAVIRNTEIGALTEAATYKGKGGASLQKHNSQTPVHHKDTDHE